MNALARTLCLACLLGLGGCYGVVVVDPIGREAKLSNGVEGLWLSRDFSSGYVFVEDVDRGLVKLCGLQRKSEHSARPELDCLSGQVREAGSRKVLHLRAEEFFRDSPNARLLGKWVIFLLLEFRGDDRLVAWLLDPEAVAKSVEAGALQGRVTRDHSDHLVELDRVDPALLDEWLSPSKASPFLWEHPVFYERYPNK